MISGSTKSAHIEGLGALPLRARIVWKGIDAGLLFIHRTVEFLTDANEALKHANFNLVYKGRPDDIFICTYPKSGTTWLQMILYQLISDGSMELPHLNLFAPYLEDILSGEIEPPDSPLAPNTRGTRRRIAKTHVAYQDIPKGCGRYIYVIRDGRDVAVSYYHHYRRNGYRKPFAEFFVQFMRGDVRFGSWFTHVSDWARNPDGLTILFIRYEDLLRDLQGTIDRIAQFCGTPVDQEQMPRILHNCSFQFMRQHEAKLDVKTRKSWALPPQEDHFIRRGRSGEWVNQFDDNMARIYNESFTKVLKRVPILGRYATEVAASGRLS